VAEVTQVQGLRQLGEAMRSLSADMRGRVARQATAAGAGVVRKAARQGAPVDSGNLQAAVVMKRQRQTRLTEEYIVTVRQGKTRDAKAGKAGGKQGKDAFYARFVEFGTVKHQAQPFMRPALENNVQAATDAMAKRLRERIEKVKAK